MMRELLQRTATCPSVAVIPFDEKYDNLDHQPWGADLVCSTRRPIQAALCQTMALVYLALGDKSLA